MSSRSTSILVLLVLFSSVTYAQQIYKWKDNKGQWHFSDAQPAEVRAEKVKGIDIGPVPPVPPQIAEPPTPAMGSESKERAVSRVRTEQQSPPSVSQSPSRWLLVLPNEIPWRAFDNEETCTSFRDELIYKTTKTNVMKGPIGSPYAGSSCLSSDELKAPKEANVIMVNTEVRSDPRGVPRHNLFGRVFNRGQSVARRVMVEYQVTNKQGAIILQGQTQTDPKDIPGLTFSDYHTPISIFDYARNRVHTEARWSKD